MTPIEGELAAVCQSIAEDGSLTEHEVHYLADWLAQNPAARETPIGSQLSATVNEILADGVVDESELHRLAPLIGEAIAAQFSDQPSEPVEARVNDSIQQQPSDRVGLVAGVKNWLASRKETRQREKLERHEAERLRIMLRQQAIQQLIHRLRSGEGCSSTVNGFITKPGEQICWVESGVLHELRVVSRQYVGGYSGARIRVAKGLSFSVGGSQGQSVSEKGLVPVSQGQLIITTQRLAFVGDRKSFAAKLDRLIDVQITLDGLQFSETGKQNPRVVRFNTTNGDFIVAVMNFVFPGQ